MSASPKRPMSEEEVVAATMLQHVTTPPASWDKRAIATIRCSLTKPSNKPECNCGIGAEPSQELLAIAEARKTHLQDCPVYAWENWQPMIGEKMVPQLWRLLYRYRRQLKHPRRAFYLRMAEQRMAPDFRKQQAALKDQSRIDALKKEPANV